MESLTWLDYLVVGISSLFIRGKFFALFSILFGLSFSLQMDNAAGRENISEGGSYGGQSYYSYVHQLFYRGDIPIYALLPSFLWILVVAALSIPRIIAFAFIGNNSAFGIHAPKLKTPRYRPILMR